MYKQLSKSVVCAYRHLSYRLQIQDAGEEEKVCKDLSDIFLSFMFLSHSLREETTPVWRAEVNQVIKTVKSEA